MQNSQLNTLENIVNKGMLHYVLTRGVLGWGLISAVLFTLAKYFMADSQSLASIGITFIIFPICGSLWGLIMWPVIERRYNEVRKQENV